MRKVQYVLTLSVKKNFWDLKSKIRPHSFVGLDQENKLNIYNMVISLELKAKKNIWWKNQKKNTWVPFWNNRLQFCWPHGRLKLVDIWVLLIHLRTCSSSGWVLMTNIFLGSESMEHQLSNALSTMFLRHLVMFLHFETYALANPQKSGRTSEIRASTWLLTSYIYLTWWPGKLGRGGHPHFLSKIVDFP